MKLFSALISIFAPLITEDSWFRIFLASIFKFLSAEINPLFSISLTKRSTCVPIIPVLTHVISLELYTVPLFISLACSSSLSFTRIIKSSLGFPGIVGIITPWTSSFSDRFTTIFFLDIILADVLSAKVKFLATIVILPSVDCSADSKLMFPEIFRSILSFAEIELIKEFSLSLLIPFFVVRFFPLISNLPWELTEVNTISPFESIAISFSLTIRPSCFTPSPSSVLISLIFLPYIDPNSDAYIPYLSELAFLDDTIFISFSFPTSVDSLFSPAMIEISGECSPFSGDISLNIWTVFAKTLK